MKIKGPAQTPAKCRLAVKFARHAPVAVILRRGPTNWVQMIRWDLKTNDFAAGQWFRGRIYEDESDLSEDGELFLYLARKEYRWQWNDGCGGSWTAISRPPYFTALNLWPHPGYCGGGIFSSRRYALLNIAFPKVLHEGTPGVTAKSSGRDSCSLQILLRSGWKLLDRRADELKAYYWRTETRLRKQNSNGIAVTWQTLEDRGSLFRDEFTVTNAHGEHFLGTADFVDFDRGGRLFHGKNGRLLLCNDPNAQALEWRELADFSLSRPEEMPPATWAREWPL